MKFIAAIIFIAFTFANSPVALADPTFEELKQIAENGDPKELIPELKMRLLAAAKPLNDPTELKELILILQKEWKTDG